MISSDAWIFRKRKGFCWLHDLSKSNLVKTAFLSIHTAVVGSNLRNSSQSGQPIGTEGKKIVSHFFSEQMFSALICLSFLPCSILILNEKSGRVILAEYNSFSSHVVKTHRLANVAVQGDIQAIERNIENWYVQNPFYLWILSIYWEHTFGQNQNN